MPAGILFGAVGPVVASVLFDASGTYVSAWTLMIVLYLLGATAILSSREPPQKVTAAQLAAMTPPTPAPIPAAAAVASAPASPIAAAAPVVATTPASLTHGGLGGFDWTLDGDGAVPTPVNGAGAPVRSAVP